MGSTIHADEAGGWDALYAHFDVKRVNHSISYSHDGVDTNQAESYFSRLRRAEIGIHHRIGDHLDQYATEMAWREDRRRVSNGQQSREVTALALAHPVSARWARYWQRSIHKEAAE